MHKQEISGSRSLDQIIWHADGNAETRTRVDSLINQLFSYFQGAHAADCYWPNPAVGIAPSDARYRCIAATQPAAGAYRFTQLNALTAAPLTAPA